MKPQYTITTDSITVVVNGKVHTVQRGAANFADLRAALFNEQWDRVPKLLTVGAKVADWAKGDFTVKGDEIRFKGETLPSKLNNRIVAMAAEGGDPTPFFRFWEKLQRNPSWRSVQQLYPFMEHGGISLDQDGNLLAYKSVRQDWKDHHTGTVDNSPGSKHEMARNKISDDPHQACHYGYHVGALRYAQSFGGQGSRLVICRVDPADVVCVPYDSAHEKMRVCRYEVIGVYGTKLPDTVFVGDKLDEKREADLSRPAPPPAPDLGLDDDDEFDEDFKAEALKAKPAKRQGVASWEDPALDKMDEVDLLSQSLDLLRRYAALKLKVVGASKIPGGKFALVQAILKAR